MKGLTKGRFFDWACRFMYYFLSAHRHGFLEDLELSKARLCILISYKWIHIMFGSQPLSSDERPGTDLRRAKGTLPNLNWCRAHDEFLIC